MAGRARLVLQAAAVAVVASLVLLLAIQVFAKSKGDSLVGAVQDGKTPSAPALELPTLDGDREISLASFRGRAVVLNFWASWCEPCKREAPMLEAAWRRHRQRGFAVLGVDAPDFGADARRFVDLYGIQ